jgi:hypothetical protein
MLAILADDEGHASVLARLLVSNCHLSVCTRISWAHCMALWCVDLHVVRGCCPGQRLTVRWGCGACKKIFCDSCCQLILFRHIYTVMQLPRNRYTAMQFRETVSCSDDGWIQGDSSCADNKPLSMRFGELRNIKRTARVEMDAVPCGRSDMNSELGETFNVYRLVLGSAEFHFSVRHEVVQLFDGRRSERNAVMIPSTWIIF